MTFLCNQANEKDPQIFMKKKKLISTVFSFFFWWWHRLSCTYQITYAFIEQYYHHKTVDGYNVL